MNRQQQAEFDFAATGRPEGLTAWQEARRQAVRAVAEKLGLPLDQDVEVRLADGVVLRGRLHLGEETLFLDRVDTANVELRIGRATFRHSEIEACVRLD
jgi:hypothetical protein